MTRHTREVARAWRPRASYPLVPPAPVRAARQRSARLKCGAAASPSLPYSGRTPLARRHRRPPSVLLARARDTTSGARAEHIPRALASPRPCARDPRRLSGPANSVCAYGTTSNGERAGPPPTPTAPRPPHRRLRPRRGGVTSRAGGALRSAASPARTSMRARQRRKREMREATVQRILARGSRRWREAQTEGADEERTHAGRGTREGNGGNDAEDAGRDGRLDSQSRGRSRAGARSVASVGGPGTLRTDVLWAPTVATRAARPHVSSARARAGPRVHAERLPRAAYEPPPRVRRWGVDVIEAHGRRTATSGRGGRVSRVFPCFPALVTRSACGEGQGEMWRRTGRARACGASASVRSSVCRERRRRMRGEGRQRGGDRKRGEESDKRAEQRDSLVLPTPIPDLS
ncbi:hypothetical protein FB451DRAFT_1377606 [Mycena latifolia]|nr:hypothetical protein FB451DRAFT_1377606 [Mycena latifolia]